MNIITFIDKEGVTMDDLYTILVNEDTKALTELITKKIIKASKGATNG